MAQGYVELDRKESPKVGMGVALLSDADARVFTKVAKPLFSAAKPLLSAAKPLERSAFGGAQAGKPTFVCGTLGGPNALGLPNVLPVAVGCANVLGLPKVCWQSW